MRAHAHAEATKPPTTGGGTPYDVAVERAVDATLRRATYGALAGGVAALALLRGPRARAACLAFGVGCGVGSAYEESQRAFADVR